MASLFSLFTILSSGKQRKEIILFFDLSLDMIAHLVGTIP